MSHLFGTLGIAHSPMPSCLHARFSVLPGLEESRMTQAQYIGVRWQMENMRVHFISFYDKQKWPISRSRFSFFFSQNGNKARSDVVELSKCLGGPTGMESASLQVG